MSNRVYFQLTKFCDISIPDLNTVESSYGYRVYDDYMQLYNNTLAADEVQKMTPERALEILVEIDETEVGDGLIDSVLNREGFYFNDAFVEVEKDDDKRVRVAMPLPLTQEE